MLIEVLYGAIRRWSVCYIVETQLSCSNMLIQWQSAQFSTLAGRFRDTLWVSPNNTLIALIVMQRTQLGIKHKTKNAHSAIPVKSCIFENFLEECLMLYVGSLTAPTVRDLLCKTWVISTDQPVRWRHFDMLRSNGAEHIKSTIRNSWKWWFKWNIQGVF